MALIVTKNPVVTHSDLPSGSVLQTVIARDGSYTNYNSGSPSAGYTLLTVNLTAKAANSNYMIRCGIAFGVQGNDSNMDSHDFFCAFRRTTPAGSNSAFVGALDSPLGNRTTSNHPGTGTSWFQTDVPFGFTRNYGTYGNTHDTREKNMSYMDPTPTVPVGQTIRYELVLWTQTRWYNVRSRDGGGDSQVNWMDVTELKA
tara:strand:+ start:999 stop:1598 length:600 start_codon:yes stop_codon:yes gene_type:complete